MKQERRKVVVVVVAPGSCCGRAGGQVSWQQRSVVDVVVPPLRNLGLKLKLAERGRRHRIRNGAGPDPKTRPIHRWGHGIDPTEGAPCLGPRAILGTQTLNRMACHMTPSQSPPAPPSPPSSAPVTRKHI